MSEGRSKHVHFQLVNDRSSLGEGVEGVEELRGGKGGVGAGI